MPQVNPLRTPYTSDDLSAALTAAWRDRFNNPIPTDVLALLMALADLETGDGFPDDVMPNCFHHNIGNIILPAQYLSTTEQSWFVLNGDEGEAADAGIAEHHYKVYQSLAHGAEALIRQLTKDSRRWWGYGLITGDPEKFIRALNGQSGGPKYFEADFDRYLRGYMSRWRRHSVQPQAMPESRDGDSVEDLAYLRRGQKGMGVALLQTALNLHGSGLAVDGDYGGETANQVARLTGSSGNNGERITRNRIVELFATDAKEPSPTFDDFINQVRDSWRESWDTVHGVSS